MDKAQSFAMQYGYYDKGKKKACCVGYNAGYKQAQKDLALTWEDASAIVEIAMDIIGEGKINGEQNIYTEVLKRFNEQRKK